MLKVTNKKIDFLTIFNNYLENLNTTSYNRYSDYGDWYDDEYDAYAESYINWWEQYDNEKSKRKKTKKKEDLVWDKEIGEFVPKSQYRKTHKKKQKAWLDSDEFDDYNDWEDYKSKNNNKDDAYTDEYKYIYFYPNVNLKSSKKEFNSLFEFDEFISQCDIDITDVDIHYLTQNKVIHCAAIEKLDGSQLLVVDNSYARLQLSVKEMKHIVQAEC